MSLTASTASRSAATLSSSQRPSAEGVLDLLAEALAEPARCLAVRLLRTEGLEELALVLREARRDAHVDANVEVAAHAQPAEMRNASAAQSDLSAGLGAGFDVDRLLAVGGGHGHARPEGRVCQRDLEVVVQLGALPAQGRMGLHVDDHVQVPARAPPRTRLALPGETDLVAVVDAGRHRHVDALRSADAPLAAAVRARLRDDLALPPALRTARHVDHLAEHGRPGDAHLAAAAALRAGRRAGARLGARAATRRAAVERVKDEFLPGPADRFGEGDVQVVAQIRSGGRTGASGGCARRPAEERIEEVPERAETGPEAA